MTARLPCACRILYADWFQWSDEPPAGRSPDGEDVNFGVVDIHDRPYDLLADAVRNTTPLLNPLHEGSTVDAQKDVWRQSFASKPTMHCSISASAPVLDGDLSEWPATAKLSDVRRDQTIGLDRRPVTAPNVYLGWTNAGIYLGMEVFDRHLETAQANGWWWTRDHVEFWIDTRPAGPEQTFYNADCQQFFFVPSVNQGQPDGAVGQWHREGDALTTNLIPQPDVKESVKISPDRYTAEIFCPRQARLHGFDPAHHSAISFNIHIGEFQSAADFFWSSPKSTQTQLRPDTWGLVYLDPASKTNGITPNMADFSPEINGTAISASASLRGCISSPRDLEKCSMSDVGNRPGDARGFQSTLVLPVYNAKDFIAATVNRLKRFVARASRLVRASGR